MSSADWLDLTGANLSTVYVDRDPSLAFTVPNNGGAFVYAMHTLAAQAGFAGFNTAQAGSIPIVAGHGGSISAAMKHYGGKTTSVPIIGVIRGTDPSTASGYLLALTMEDTYKIGLFKATPAAGGFLSTAAATKLLRSSTASYTDSGDTAAAWKHLRLDVLVNPHSEVVLNVYENALGTNPVTAPVWLAPAGMARYIDDSVGILSGSAPLVDSFRFVFGMYTTANIGGQVLFDQITAAYQVTP